MLTCLMVTIFLAGPVCLVLNLAGAKAASPVWAPPAILLPYVADNPSLCINPLDSTMTYFAGSGGYGMVAGSEGNNWLNGTFTKLSDLKGSGDCVYDEYGTLHAVWSLRTGGGNFNIFYNSVQKGSGNVPLYRNLTQEIYGQDKYTIKTDIAVSIPQHKVFITYQERREGGDTLMFIESSNQGGSWSKPLQLGILSGYRPAEPDIIVDKAGLPHIFYGVFKDGGPSVIYHRERLADGIWTAPENITGNDQTRPIWTQAELDPVSGDIYVSWLEVQSGISRWNAATGKWTFVQNISNSGGRAFFPTIAVNSQTGVVWDIWADGPNIWGRQSLDHGQTWQGKELVVNEDAAKIGRMFGLKARSTRGIIYLLFSADQLDPLYYVGPTLSLMTINQSVSAPEQTPTTTPSVTGTPGGTATPVIQPTLSPGPITPNTTATPVITMVATPLLTATPQPTATLVPTVTLVPTATPAPTATPQPTATPMAVPTAVPTVQPTTAPPPTAAPTATSKPGVPASTSTPLPVPAQLPGQPQNQGSQAGQGQGQTAQITQAPTVQPTATLQSTGPFQKTVTIAPEMEQATAVAEAQRIAASTPQSLVVPLAPPGSGGKGPLLVLPTSTPVPTSTMGATSTPKPTATIDSYKLTVEARSALTVAAQDSTSSSGNQLKPVQVNVQAVGPVKGDMPPTGPLWLLPIGLAVAVKGFLNLMAFRLRP